MNELRSFPLLHSLIHSFTDSLIGNYFGAESVLPLGTELDS